MSRNLVIYYSRRGQNYFGGNIVEIEKGNAEQLAEYISEATGADVFEVRTVKDYPEDFSYYRLGYDKEGLKSFRSSYDLLKSALRSDMEVR